MTGGLFETWEFWGGFARCGDADLSGELFGEEKCSDVSVDSVVDSSLDGGFV